VRPITLIPIWSASVYSPLARQFDRLAGLTGTLSTSHRTHTSTATNLLVLTATSSITRQHRSPPLGPAALPPLSRADLSPATDSHRPRQLAEMSYIERATDYAQTLYRNLRQRYDDLSFEGKVSQV
jgi:hypothetical protein